jgi:hypothetical protein
MHVGDTWEYAAAYPPGDIIITHRITGQADINGYPYFVMVQTTLGHADTTYYRIDSNGSVFSRHAGTTGDRDLYHLNASVGDKWETNFFDDGRGFTTLTSLDDIRLNNVTLHNCKGYYFDVPEWADEETMTTLAPGLGMVRQGGSWSIGISLKHAVIDGQSFDF